MVDSCVSLTEVETPATDCGDNDDGSDRYPGKALAALGEVAEAGSGSFAYAKGWTPGRIAASTVLFGASIDAEPLGLRIGRGVVV